MIYTADTIPAKIFSRISRTEDFTLLSTESHHKEKLSEAWDKIIDDPRIEKEDSKNEVLRLSNKIEQFSSKYNKLFKALIFLTHQRDSDLEKIVAKEGFQLNEDTFFEDVKEAVKLIETIQVQKAKYEEELKELLEGYENKEASTFEDVLMMYSSSVGTGYIEANKITQLEYQGLKKQLKAKIKQIEKSKNVK